MLDRDSILFGCANVFLSGMFIFVPSDTFAVGCVVQPQNAQTIRRALVVLVLLFTNSYFGQSRLSGFSLGAFHTTLPVESDRAYQPFVNL